MQKQLKET